MRNYLYIDSDDDAHQTKFKVSQTPDIDYLIKEEKYSEALREVNKLLDSDSSWDNWNLKGIILTHMSDFKEAVSCFNKALELNSNDEIKINMANAYYSWAKITFFPEGNCEEGLYLINKALEILPDDEDSGEYYFLKAEILEGLNQLDEAHKNYLIAHKEFERLKEFEIQRDYLKNSKDNLINITGCSFYNYNPHPGEILSLIKDSENEHDPDAVKAVLNDETVGYVANSEYTLIDEVKSASDIINLISDDSKAEIKFIYLGEYVISKLI